MRHSLDRNKLRRVYDRVARWYDFQHAFFTGGTDQLGRKLLVEHAVCPGDRVLDAGAGTGSTALLAAEKAATHGRIVLFDLSEGMLNVARQKAAQADRADQFEYHVGDLLDLPFDDASFDTVLSTYSLCPLYDPAQGVLELYRVLKPGGRLGVAHSTRPKNACVRWIANRVEDVAWLLPRLSLGCRAVSVLPALEEAGAQIVFRRTIGLPILPFVVGVVVKPE